MSKSSLYTIKPLVVALSLALVQVSSLGGGGDTFKHRGNNNRRE